MSIHKSYRITVSLGCIFATQAYAANKLRINSSVDTCHILFVNVSRNILDDYIFTLSQFVMNHGVFEGCEYKNGELHLQL